LLVFNYSTMLLTVSRRGTGNITTTNWLRKKIYNHYHRIDVPVLIGYQSTKKDKRMGWFVEGGVAMNLWFKAQGDMVGVNNELLHLNEQSDLFKKRTGVSLLGAAGVTYKITNKIGIWASPEVKSNLNSITSDDNVLGQKYLNVGLGIGVRYYWSEMQN